MNCLVLLPIHRDNALPKFPNNEISVYVESSSSEYDDFSDFSERNGKVKVNDLCKKKIMR